LTELRNRRYVYQTIGADVAASLRRHRDSAAGGPPPKDGDLLFFLLDVDAFKAVNDHHRHAAGARVLAGVARRLEAACRQSDVVARWGGEEFLVVARLTDRTQAAAQAERLRRSVADGSFALDDGRGLTVTCSVGFAAFPFCRRQPEVFGWEQVVAVADHGAYVAKRRGRDSWIGLSAVDGATLGGAPRQEDLDGWMEEGRLVVEASAPSDAEKP